MTYVSVVKTLNFYYLRIILYVLPWIDEPIGGCAYLTAGDRCVFYLVTKARYYYKPTMATLESSISTMRNLCIKHNVHYLAMPRIGCGLDKLDWAQVSVLIQRIFENDDIEITIYSL